MINEHIMYQVYSKYEKFVTTILLLNNKKFRTRTIQFYRVHDLDLDPIFFVSETLALNMQEIYPIQA